MKAAGFAGAVTDDGENLRVVTREDLETLPPGVYSLGETRQFTGRDYVGCMDVWASHKDDPQELIARVSKLPAQLPEGVDLAFYRLSDGKRIVIDWEFTDPVRSFEDPRVPKPGPLLRLSLYRGGDVKEVEIGLMSVDLLLPYEEFSNRYLKHAYAQLVNMVNPTAFDKRLEELEANAAL